MKTIPAYETLAHVPHARPARHPPPILKNNSDFMKQSTRGCFALAYTTLSLPIHRIIREAIGIFVKLTTHVREGEVREVCRAERLDCKKLHLEFR